jgi:hypothetical protein
MSYTHSVEETIPENKEITITSTNFHVISEHHEHVNEFLSLPHRRVRTLSE